jgi:hypothetical protein
MAGNARGRRAREAGISAGDNAAAAMSVPEVFRRITEALDQAGIAYMLSGSFASAYHGAPRSTQDIDCVIEATPAQLRTLVQGQEFSRRQPANFQGLRLFVASVEDLMISKLEWSKLAHSQRQIDDVAAILRIREGSFDHSYLKKWIADLELEAEWAEARRAARIPR